MCVKRAGITALLRKNLGWVSLVSKSNNTVLVVDKSLRATRDQRVEDSVAVRQQPKKRRMSSGAETASPAEQICKVLRNIVSKAILIV